MLKSSADLQFINTDFQIERSLMVKAVADNVWNIILCYLRPCPYYHFCYWRPSGLSYPMCCVEVRWAFTQMQNVKLLCCCTVFG